MIAEILNLGLFFCISIIYFYSTIGYGQLLNHNNSNFFEYQFDGTIFLLLVGYFFYLTIGINLILNLIIILFGIFLFFFNNKKKYLDILRYIFLLFFLLFSVLLISKTHEDFIAYHFFSIFEVFNNNLRIGLSLLNKKFFHSSLLIFNQALTVLPYVKFKIVHLPIFIIYVSTIGYFLIIIFSKNQKREELFFSLLCVLILLIKFNRLSEFGYDYIAQFILLIVFHKIYFLNSNNSEIIKANLYFILCVLIKPISLLFLPILFFVIYKNGFAIFKKISFTNYFLILLLAITLFSSSFFRTGCLFYPLNMTCFSNEKVFWGEKKRVKEYSQVVSLWAKSYYAQNDSKYQKIEDINQFKKNYNWIKFWIEKHFFYKISEYILIVLSSILIIYFYCTSKQSPPYKNKKEKVVVLILTISSIIFLLNTVPQFRFGFTSITIFLFILIIIFLDFEIKIDKKKFINLLILGLVVLNLKNFNRINKEFKMENFYEFKNFPFYNEPIIKNDYSNIKRENFFHIEFLK